MPQQHRRLPEGLVGQDRGLTRGAVLQEPLQHAALHLILSRLDHTASEGVDHELDLLGEQIHDELLHHVVAMRRQRHLPNVAAHRLRQHGLAHVVGAIHLDGLLKQARAALGRSEHRGAVRQTLEVRARHGRTRDETEASLMHSDLRRVVELVARHALPLNPLAHGEHRHSKLGRSAGNRVLQHAMGRSILGDGVHGHLQVRHGVEEVQHESTHVLRALHTRVQVGPQQLDVGCQVLQDVAPDLVVPLATE
mmetsp:Transcript_65130/g.210942  ORF Transcript_65130/g.210942 Transcript_65130/m.210942 type:complete len:251 (+) Transcript_65130:526-1278(+)